MKHTNYIAVHRGHVYHLGHTAGRGWEFRDNDENGAVGCHSKAEECILAALKQPGVTVFDLQAAEKVTGYNITVEFVLAK